MPAEPWSIIQACTGVYCAIITTFAWLFPRHATPRGTTGTAVRVTGLRIATLIGVVAFVLSLAAPAIYRLFGTTWATLALALLVVIIAAIILYARNNSARMTAARQRTGDIPESPVAMATRDTFESLSISQRFIVKEVYDHPRTPDAFLGAVATNLGFRPRTAVESLRKVLTTNLVNRDTTRHVEPNPAVKEIVESLLGSASLPPVEIVKQITAEISAAMALDCKVGTEALRSQLQQMTAERDAAKQLGEQQVKVTNEAWDKVNKLSGKFEVERSRKRPLVERAGVLRSYAGQADWLHKFLREIKALYEAQGEQLPQPLARRTLPDTIRTDADQKLYFFRSLCESQIGALKKIDSRFFSNFTTDGFPCDGEYSAISRKIEAHAAFLRDHADRLIRSDVSGEDS
jgi:hypothetical protein